MQQFQLYPAGREMSIGGLIRWWINIREYLVQAKASGLVAVNPPIKFVPLTGSNLID